MDPLTWAVIGAGASVAGAYIGGEANKEAANTAAQAQMRASEAQTAAIRQASQQAEARYNEMREEGRPGVDYLRRTVGEQGNLTPLQKQQLEEIQRQQTNQVRTSAIAGSGRTAAALFRNTSNDFINRSLEANRGRSFSAADRLAGERINASMGAARDIPGYTARAGQVQGDAINAVGGINANSTIATGKLYGSAIGDIGSYIASSGRPSRFRSQEYEPAAASPQDYQRYPGNAYA
jgi:hypothetical protein